MSWVRRARIPLHLYLRQVWSPGWPAAAVLDFHTKLSSVCSTCDHLQLYCTHCVPCSSSHFVSLGPRALVRRLAWFRWCWLFPWLHCVSLCLCFLSRTLASAVVAMKHADIKTYVVLQWKVCTLEVLNVTSLTCVLIYNYVADLSSYEATLEERRWPCSLWKHKLWPHTCNTAVNVWLQCYRLDLLHFSFIQGQEWGSHLSHLQVTTAHCSVLCVMARCHHWVWASVAEAWWSNVSSLA